MTVKPALMRIVIAKVAISDQTAEALAMHSPSSVPLAWHSVNISATSSVPPMRVKGFWKEMRTVTRVTKATSTIGLCT